MDIDALAALLAGHDAVIAAYNPDRTVPGDVFERMVAGARAIIEATKKAGVKRLLVVGGAGSLEVAPGQQMIDQPDFPPEWKGGAGGTRQFLYLLKEEPDLDWTFLSPAAMLQPGERTGTFRLGGDQMLVDAEGRVPHLDAGLRGGHDRRAGGPEAHAEALLRGVLGARASRRRLVAGLRLRDARAPARPALRRARCAGRGRRRLVPSTTPSSHTSPSATSKRTGSCVRKRSRTSSFLTPMTESRGPHMPTSVM